MRAGPYPGAQGAPLGEHAAQGAPLSPGPAQGAPLSPGPAPGASGAPPGSKPRRPFPWDDVMALCLGEIGLAPVDFWAATPLEVAAMIRGRRHRLDPDHVAPPSRDEVERLSAAFPDDRSNQHAGART
ncbi:MAG: phage tail assembly chaperone [Ancalomicrobiaceae bacterium]|nr:phage tail assembly chaperone [Ancalomicrobiaceae bacterium]